MKRRIILLIIPIMSLMSVVVYAEPKEDYEQAYKLYMAAGACMAAYSDRYGNLANRYLEQDGWIIDHYDQTHGSANIRFLLAKKQLENREAYILAIVGTENIKDLKLDLKVDKVYFSGANLDAFEINAAKNDVPATEPKVHRGFHQFVQAGLATKTMDDDGQAKYLTEILLAHSERRIFLVGHSLGGAAATLTGARLISMGVRPEQIEIITFGAPAVGNAAFAAKVSPILNLTRVVISGDPVTGILQSLVGGYKQFGREVEWDMPANTYQPHSMAEYVDLVIKNYYDKRNQAERAAVISSPVTMAGTGMRAYVAPLKNNLPAQLAGEYRYMQQVLWDEYRKILPGYVLSVEPDTTGNLLRKAAAAGCERLVIPEVSGYRLKQERNVYYISLNQIVYDVVTGAVATMADFSMGTYEVTPLEALLADFRGMNVKW